MAEHTPKRTSRNGFTSGEDVFPQFGGFTKTAKAGRSFRDDERGPRGSGGRPTSRNTRK